MITIVTLGILAVMVLPSFHSGINDKVYENSKKVFEGKFKEALHRMRVDGTIAERYSSTSDFVSVLAKHIQIGKICDNNNLSDCFSGAAYDSADNLIYDFNTQKNTSNLGGSFASELVGVSFGDGTSALIGYKPNCAVTDIYDVNTDVTKCLAVVYDVNAKDKPNTMNADIATINLGHDESCPDGTELVEASGMKLCVDKDGIQAYGSYAFYGTYTDTNGNQQPNYWAGANKYCQDKGLRLPSNNELLAFLHTDYNPLNNGYMWTVEEKTTIAHKVIIAREVPYQTDAPNFYTQPFICIK